MTLLRRGSAAPAGVAAAAPMAGRTAATPGVPSTGSSSATGPDVALAAVPWRDPKRLLWLIGLVVPLLPVLGLLGARATGWGAFYWSGPLWIYVGIPLLDAVLGEDRSNPPETAVAGLEEDRYYRWCTYLYLPLQYGGLVLVTWWVARHHLAPVDLVGWALTVGLVGGAGINAAHELGHKRAGAERWLSRVALAQTCYGHFYVEHNRGHHSRVATPEDPASARYGESFWAFLPRTVAGSVASAWALERGRLARTGRRPGSVRNKVLQAWALSVALYVPLVAWLGLRVVPFLAVQVVFGFSLLEVVNYVEHYGLLRAELPTGRYERCQPRHSWNSNHVASNLALYNLERHSDHHANPTRRYQTLRHFDEAPQLPSGYGLMIGLAYVPPLWRSVMDPRVVALTNGDLRAVNLRPRLRAALDADPAS